MLKNYIKIAWRNLIRNKGYALINISGLALALAVFMVILFYIRHETNYDSHLPGSNQIYRVLAKNSDGEVSFTGTPMGLQKHMKELFPEVIRGVKVRPPSNTERLFEYNGKQIYQDGLMSASSDFFHTFRYEFIHGTRDQSLYEPRSIVITKALSEKLFGRRNAVGEAIKINKNRTYTVKGVVENPPSNTHLKFSAVVHLRERNMSSWRGSNGTSYILLDDNQVKNLQKKLPSYVQTYAEYGGDASLEKRGLVLQPVGDVHLYPYGRESGSDKLVYIRIFFAIAFLIMLIACFNYINLATARSMERAREIGVRKTVGATRWQIVQQVMTETLVTCLIAFGMGLAMLEVSLPYIQGIFNVGLSGMSWMNPEGILILFGVLIGVALLSGAYYAFYLSSFNPDQTFRGTHSGKWLSSSRVRKGLVVSQFAVSLVVIIAAVLISRQMNYVQETRLDGQDSQILVLNNRSEVISRQFGVFRQQLLQYSAVTNVAAGDMLGEFSMWGNYKDSTGTPSRVQWVEGTHEYLETLGLTLISGRFLNPRIASDSAGNVLINKAAAQRFGIDKAAGQFIPDPVEANVVGIFENYHARSFYETISPTIVRFNDGSMQMRNIFVRLQKGKLSDGIQQVRKAWNSFSPEYPFDYTFLNQELNKQYRSELRMATIFRSFAGFSVFIACLGLFGLAAYSARRRTKEIGIRKVLGATASNIVILLSKDFLLLVGVGFLLSIPVVWYGIQQWLENFAYRIDVSPLIFVAAGLGVLLIALLTVSGQSLKAALKNPANSLRTE